MPLVQGLTIDSSTNVFSPTVLCSLPTVTGFEVDAVQPVFSSDTANVEIGNRVLVAPTANRFTFGTALPAGLELTVNVRRYDLVDRQLGLVDSSNIPAASRAFVNDAVTPVPEPARAALRAGGIGVLALIRRGRRGGKTATRPPADTAA